MVIMFRVCVCACVPLCVPVCLCAHVHVYMYNLIHCVYVQFDTLCICKIDEGGDPGPRKEALPSETVHEFKADSPAEALAWTNTINGLAVSVKAHLQASVVKSS